MPATGPRHHELRTIPPDFWRRADVLGALAHRDISELIRLLTSTITGAALSQADIARLTGIASATISKYRRRSRDALTFDVMERLASGLNMPNEARQTFGLAPKITVRDGSAAVADLRGDGGSVRAGGLPAVLLVPTGSEEEATNRRVAMQLGGSAAAGVFLDKLWSEPSRMHEALDSGTVSPTYLAHLQQKAVNLSIRVVQVPPASLLQETLSTFRDVADLATKKQTMAAQRELVRCAAMFATIMGEILFNEGHFSLAEKWYGIAVRSAHEVKDQYLADIALAGSTYIPTYTPDPRGVLANVDARLEGNPSPTPAVAWLWGFKAKAHAALGDEVGFRHAIERSREILQGSSGDSIHPGIFSFVPEKLSFYEARGWVELGDETAASAAAEQAIAAYDPSETTEPALVRFEQASAFAQAGDMQEACRVATDALIDQRTYHGVTVLTRAREFDRLLPSANNGPIGEWREILANTSSRRLAVTGSQ